MSKRSAKKEQAAGYEAEVAGVGKSRIKRKEFDEKRKKYIIIKDYITDRKAVILLLLSTAIIFVAVCGLYQLHNLSKILYALLLAVFFWSVYGCFDFYRYVQKQERLRLAGQHPEQTADALLGDFLSDRFLQLGNDRYSLAEGLSQLDKTYIKLIEDLCKFNSTLKSETEKHLGEMTDYYMMWAHQIKTPIAAIKLLINGREDGFLLMEELFKIEQYVEMVLHYLRLESMASDMIIKEYELQTLLKQTLRKYSVLFINSGLSLQLEDFKVTVLSDEKWLSFVLEQIISNSIKYTKKGTISIYMKPEAEKTLVIEDTGIGIRQEDIPRIFDRGFTGYNGHMDKKSTGIGLYLCKQIINQLAHGISVTSVEGVGTKIYLDLSRESYLEHAD